MIRKAEHRAFIRLRVEKGLVVLHAPNLPGIACEIEDLSEGGCLCKLCVHMVEPTVCKEWEAYLKKGVAVSAELGKLPHLERIQMEAGVTHVALDKEGDIDIGLAFHELTEAQHQRLREALLKVAMDKVRPVPHAPPPPSPAEKAPEKSSSMVSEKAKLRETMYGKPLSEVIARLQLLSQHGIEEAEKAAAEQHLELPAYLLKRHMLDPVQICRAVALQSGLPVASVKDLEIPRELTHIFTYLKMMRHDFVPFSTSHELLCIASAHPLSVEVLNELQRICNKPILLFIAPLDHIRSQLFRLRPRGSYQDRHDFRYASDLKATFMYLDKFGVEMEEEEHAARVIDISKNGVLLRADSSEKFKIQDLLERGAQIRAAVVSGSDTLHFSGHITHIEVPAEKEVRHYNWRIGVAISDASPRDRELLQSFCDDAAKRQLSNRVSGFQ